MNPKTIDLDMSVNIFNSYKYVHLFNCNNYIGHLTSFIIQTMALRYTKILSMYMFPCYFGMCTCPYNTH